jgi:hypothetical protein
MRGQTSLPALAVAFFVLTAGIVIGVVAAEAALFDAERPALDRQAAVGVSDALVRAGAPVTARANVFNASAVTRLSISDIRDRYGLSADASVRIRLDDRTLVSTGDPSGGATVERVVLVERRGNRTVMPAFEGSRTVTLPRRSPLLTVTVRPPPNTTVRTVRVNGRVRLYNTSGVNGTYALPVTTAETARVRFESVGPLAEGNVSIRYYPSRTEKARLAVTVDG